MPVRTQCYLVKAASIMTDSSLIPCSSNMTVSNYISNVQHMSEIYIFILMLVRDE